ncbi:MAG: cellulase family glycosylhydrolase, partial [Planctomycetes bacterium]|nr:cellulase family glycosylhydrolase [Planctomycetota bacterium]
LPVHPAAWRNRGDHWYFDRIDEAIRWSKALGIYLILDWHSIGNLKTGLFQHPMYATSPVETANFWKGVAHRYQGVPTLAVYELFNEPTDNYIGAGSGSLGAVSWAEWRDIQESLIDLIRVYDPGVIPLVAGFNWAYDLSHVGDQPIRRDGVAYAIHPYPQKAQPAENTRAAFFELWQKQWGKLSDEYPLIATEFGWVAENGHGAHVPVINNDGSYGPNLVTFLEERHISWTAWSFDPDWSPTLISDWSFTPTEQGRFFRNVLQLAGKGPIPHSILPSPRVTEYPWMSISTWRDMHAEDVAIADSVDVSLLFLGDSITEGWPDSVWDAHFGAYRAANFGIGGDKTQNVLWRLQNGAVGQLNPDVV